MQVTCETSKNSNEHYLYTVERKSKMKNLRTWAWSAEKQVQKISESWLKNREQQLILLFKMTCCQWWEKWQNKKERPMLWCGKVFGSCKALDTRLFVSYGARKMHWSKIDLIYNKQNPYICHLFCGRSISPIQDWENAALTLATLKLGWFMQGCHSNINLSQFKYIYIYIFWNKNKNVVF